MSQQHIDSPMDLLRFQLRTALTMEEDSMAALKDLAGVARSREVKHLFTHHQDETQEQIENLHRVFELFEFPATGAGSPATKGISKQAHALIERTAPELHDQVTLLSALGNEHFEMSVYQGLITAAGAADHAEAVKLLTANLDQETHTSEELLAKLQEITG